MKSPVEATPDARRGLWSRWVRFLDRREPGHPLALFRIACGLCVLASVGSVVLHGLVPTYWLNPEDGGFASIGLPPRLFQLLGGVTPATVWTVVAACLLSGSFLAIGIAGRLSAFLALQSYLALTGIHGEAGGAYDWLLTNALWLLVLSRSSATLSLDCRIRTGCWTSNEPIPAWPRYLVIFQLVLVYWSTGMHKVSGAWTPAGGFSALYYILQEPTWRRWDMSWLAWVYPLTQAATAVSWIWEISAPLLLLALWYRRTRDRPGRLRAFFNRIDFRRLYVLIGIAVHVGIFVMMDVGPFSCIMLSYYLCLFHPAEWQSAWRRFQGRAQITVPSGKTVPRGMTVMPPQIT